MADVIMLNFTVAGNVTIQNKTPAPSVGRDRYDWFQVAIPIVSLCGILGNVLNLIILTRKRMVVGMDRLGRTANYGLIGLAVSDFLFCVVVFPHSFLNNGAVGQQTAPLGKYYRLYGIAAINLFIMISTWLIVSMAVKRYIVVVYPLHAREQLTIRRTALVILTVYLGSVLLTLPYFLHLAVRATGGENGTEVVYKYRPVWSKRDTKNMQLYMRWIWPIIAHFVPVVLLVFCNVRLIRELKGARLIRRSSCPGQKIKERGNKVTLTLVIIVLMLLILVSPAELLKYVNPYKSWGYVGHIVASVANMMQTVNFSFNFLLYFAVNANFRQTFRALLPPCLDFCFPDKASSASRAFTRTMSRSSRTLEIDL
ncbi:hypothetical protein LSH36_234g02020 [Paralvinella palmiformis]|uniref:G-protein coupled receptors family 1 profile domain-containing protein n=1 Tax=Paralvinella palmiformis TaxID=53620 RepID=A0AAD9N501_9ANNE|nr:hypothetical protein LSH36_234g02020 [Paralvinella palmiformis]